MEIGDRIRALRKQRGLTLEEVGEQCGVGKSTVRKWESGAIRGIKQTNLAKLAKALGTTPEMLMGWDADKEKTRRLSREVQALEELQDCFGKDSVECMAYFIQLNDDGQAKAIGQLQDLLEVPKYRKEVAP